ncbi:MAG: sulfurtransferase TusA family protein [Planctomycetes bacterium]|nr:sulfurtransferase TusA family protein [Planctomycetota bacterium]
MLKTLSAGDVLEISATDPGSVADFSAFCNQTGNELLSSSSEGDIYKFEIKRT